jgi:hypothetical protein
VGIKAARRSVPLLRPNNWSFEWAFLFNSKTRRRRNNGGERASLKRQDKDLHIRIDTELLKDFRTYSETINVSQSDLLRAYIMALVCAQITPAITLELRGEPCER